MRRLQLIFVLTGSLLLSLFLPTLLATCSSDNDCLLGTCDDQGRCFTATHKTLYNFCEDATNWRKSQYKMHALAHK